MIGHFDEEAFKADLRTAMAWGPNAQGADRVVEFVKAWFDLHPLLQLPCRHMAQVPESGRTTVRCRCGTTWDVRYNHERKYWEAEMVPREAPPGWDRAAAPR